MVEETTTQPFLSDRAYHLLRNIVTLALPAAGTLYFTLAQIWGLPAGEQVVGTIAAINVFLGVLLQLSSKSYQKSDARFDGDMNIIQQDDGTQTYSLELNADPADLADKSEIIFKVQPQ